MGKKLLKRVLSIDKWKQYPFDIIFAHNVGLITDGMMFSLWKRYGINVSDKYLPYFHLYGNVGSISLPLGLFIAQKDGRLKRGMNAVYGCPAAGVQCGLMFFKY